MKLFLLLSLELSEHCAVINRRRNGDLISSSETSNAPVMPGTEVARVTLSDSDSAPVPKFFNPDPEIFQIWESDSCSDSGYRRCDRNSATFLLKEWHLQRPGTLLLVPKIKNESWSGIGFSQIFDSFSGSGSEKERRIHSESTPALRIRGTSGQDRAISGCEHRSTSHACLPARSLSGPDPASFSIAQLSWSDCSVLISFVFQKIYCMLKDIFRVWHFSEKKHKQFHSFYCFTISKDRKTQPIFAFTSPQPSDLLWI